MISAGGVDVICTRTGHGIPLPDYLERNSMILFPKAETHPVRFVRLIAIIAWLVLTGWSNPSAAQQPIQQSGDDQIRIPRAGEFFEKSHNSTLAFRSQFQFIDMPQLYVGELAARPIEAAAESPAHAGVVSYPVALTAYESPAATNPDDPANKAATPAKPAVAPLNWDWTPANDLPIDAKLLDQLNASVERVKGEVAALADEEARVSPNAKLDVATERLTASRSTLAKLDERQVETTAAPDVLKQLEAEKATSLPAVPTSIDTSQTIEVHTIALNEIKQAEIKLREDLALVESRIKERTTLLETIPKQRVEQTAKLAAAARAITEQIAAAQPDQALLVENQAIAVACILDLRMLDVNQAWVVATEKLGALRKELLKRKLDHTVASSKALQVLIDDFRKQLARAEEEKARHAAANADPRVAEIADENAKWAKRRSEVAVMIEREKAEQLQLDALIGELDATQRLLNKHIEKAKHSQSVGILLRFQRSKLPPTKWHRNRVAEISRQFPIQSLQQLDIEELIEGIDQRKESLRNSIETGQAVESTASREKILQAADELINTNKTYLTDLNSDYELYLSGLTELRTAHDTCIEKINSLKLFIDQHVLWIRSAQPLNSSDVEKSLAALNSIAAMSKWKGLADGLGSQLKTRWPVLVMIGLALWMAIGMRRRLNHRLRLVSCRKSDMRFGPIMRSSILTLLQASFFPILVATLGWLLSDMYESGSLKDAISQGLLAIAPQLLIGSVIYRFCMRGGLAEEQLGWVPAVTGVIRSAAGRIIRYCLPLMAVSRMLEVLDEGHWSDSLGRFVFMGAMLAFSWVSFRLLRGIGRCWKADDGASRSVWVQTFGLWAPVIVLAPLALAGMAAFGFQYSAVFLAGRLLLTWWALLGIVALYYLVSRMVEIGHNRIKGIKVWQKAIAADDEEQVDNSVAEAHSLAVRLQVQRLLHVSSVATFLIMVIALWAEVLPAISALDIEIWGPFERQVQEKTLDGPPTLKTEIEWITVGDLLVCLVILAGTVVLSRNLPGLLEMLLLDRLPLDRGGRYAVAVVCRYLVGMAGLTLAFGTIGVSWHSIQWLVAAMGVGLGFGLQEIFANFVSGIIILIERPIRVGDVVTVNGVTGSVSKMQLRATTITDFDRRELIVPNKKFITDEVINWTLSDQVTRIVIPVGIAYGSDTRLAHRTLLRIARENRRILKDPEPSVVFKAFGASSLDFELRIHIPNRDHFPDAVHELHMAIDDEFRRQKIEIAFPQQDVRIKGMDIMFDGGNSGSGARTEEIKKAA